METNVDLNETKSILMQNLPTREEMFSLRLALQSITNDREVNPCFESDLNSIEHKLTVLRSLYG